MEEICFAFVMVVFVGAMLFAAHDSGRESGHIRVASGQVVCQLEEQKDKTQKWKCESAKGEGK